MDIEARLREKEMALQKKQEEFTLAAKEIKERNKLLLPPDGVDVRSRAAKRQSLCCARSGLPRQVPNFAGTVLDVVSKASMNAKALRRLELLSQGFHRHMSRNRTIKILLAAAAQQVYKHIRQ